MGVACPHKLVPHENFCVTAQTNPYFLAGIATGYLDIEWASKIYPGVGECRGFTYTKFQQRKGCKCMPFIMLAGHATS